MSNPTDLSYIAVPEADYFKQAREWADDRYQAQARKARHWFIAFCLQTVCVVLLVLGLIFLLPLKTLVPLVIHQNHLTGEVWVEQPKNWNLTENRPLIESDLVRYVIARETVATADDVVRRKQVLLRTQAKLVGDYQQQRQQQYAEKILLRKIRVEDVVFINDSLVKVDLVTMTKTSRGVQYQPWVVTLRWSYQGTPKSKALAWDNWNGFLVTYYRIDQRNVKRKIS